MSSIRANITNVYQSGERISRQVGLQAGVGDDDANQVGAADLRKEMSNLSSANRKKRSSRREDVGSTENQRSLPADGNARNQRIVHSDKNQVDDFKRASEAGNASSSKPPSQDAKAAYQDGQEAELELRKSHREGILRQYDAAGDRANKNAVKNRESATQSKSLSVLEQFMQKLREQAKARRLENDDELLNGVDPQPELSSQIADSMGLPGPLDGAVSYGASSSSIISPQEDQDMHTIRRRIHDDFYSSPQFQAAGSVNSQASKSTGIETKQPESMLPAHQVPVAQRPVYEAIEPPYPIDLEDYVKKLTLALIPEMPPELGEDPNTEGTRVLEHLQREGVFGLSPQGRYQSVNDFIRTKEFEFEMEQKPFTEDEFLLQTENAIYDVLRRGNSSSVAKSLIQAAEAVNSFRNHLIHSSGEDLSAAPAVYSSSQALTSKQATAAYGSQK